ncbi:MAG: peptidoglycan-binding protein, partial [Acetobacteraceae bacterium]|nr:peptidoglycan-binding protein [Acetobacteraceae bacterium]
MNDNRRSPVIKVRDFAAVMALGALAALPGCSMFGGGNENQPAATAAAAPAPAPAPAPVPAPPAGSSAEENQASHATVRQVQQVLTQKHMYSGRPDGIWGPRTRRGLIAFQHANNLNASGDLDDATLQAMNITPAAGGGSASGGGMSGGGMSDM